eukprot:403348176
MNSYNRVASLTQSIPKSVPSSPTQSKIHRLATRYQMDIDSVFFNNDVNKSTEYQREQSINKTLKNQSSRISQILESKTVIQTPFIKTRAVDQLPKDQKNLKLNISIKQKHPIKPPLISTEEQIFYDKMKSFVESYQDIFNFQKDKIETELKTILEYYYHNSQKFDIKNVDLVDDALGYHEKLLKYNSINRGIMKNEGNKGVNKCKDNKKAFYEYKLGRLFLRHKEMDTYEIDQERKKLVQRVARKLKKDMNELKDKKSYSITVSQKTKGTRALHMLKMIAQAKNSPSNESLLGLSPEKTTNRFLNMPIIQPKTKQNSVSSLNDYYSEDDEVIEEKTEEMSVSKIDAHSKDDLNENLVAENQQNLPDVSTPNRQNFKFNNILERVKQRMQKNQESKTSNNNLPIVESKTLDRSFKDQEDQNAIKNKKLPLIRASMTTNNSPQGSTDDLLNNSLINKTMDTKPINKLEDLKIDINTITNINLHTKLDFSNKNEGLSTKLSTQRKKETENSNRSIMITNKLNFSSLHPKIKFIQVVNQSVNDNSNKKRLSTRSEFKRMTFLSPTPIPIQSPLRDKSFDTVNHDSMAAKTMLLDPVSLPNSLNTIKLQSINHHQRQKSNNSTIAESNRYHTPINIDQQLPTLSSKVTEINRKRIKNVIHACLYLEQETKQSRLSQGIKEFERDHYLEELRQDRLNDTIDLLREIEIAENPKKLKQLYLYKVMTQDDYLQEQRIIKTEYRSGLMDPSREVARIEKKRNNKQNQTILKK